MATAGNITAVLTLNSSGFQNGLTNAINSLTNFKTNANSLNSTISNLSKVLGTLERELVLNADSLQNINNMLANNRNFNSFANAINNIAKALKTLSSDELNVVQATNTINSMFSAFKGALNGVEVKVKGVSTSFKELSTSEDTNAVATEKVATATKQYDSALSVALPKQREMIINATGVANANRQLSSSSNQVSSAENKQSLATDKATNSMRKQETASKSLGRAFSSLKMMGTMVGSMIAYNFVHNLAMATTETINAKSEMNGYFQMLGYTTRQTEDFNRALDNTVKKFPRLNKYALGETISSIGVEFELSTKEMKKAMPVVSMITSEYLRAGRNVNEASLAVKDILQGEFQRLSRETGVKGDQLKEAGWSGDKNDVMGLLEALEKVGKERNWDTFVQKANSLNDAVLITQNRFSEWSADMVERVQPAIVGTFNAIMEIAGKFSGVLNGIIDWLSGNSWSATAVKIGAVALAVRNLMLAFISARTGANLLQISQMGLLRSIGATILGLEAETVATNGIRGALAMKLTGLSAEKVAEIGSTQAIYGKILGLKAEEVAENGLVGAINKNIISREAETVATVENSGANIGFLGSLTAVITGEEIATGTTLTLSEALGVLTAEMLMSPIGIFIASLTALAGAFYIATGGLDEHWAKMQQFNEVLENSDDIVKSHENYLKQLGETVGTSSDEYITAKSKIEEFNEELGHSKALVQAYKDEVASIDISISTSLEMNSKYAGMSQEDIDELSNYVSSLKEGYNTYYRALQVVHKQEDDFDKSDRTLLANMKDREAEEGEIISKREEHAKHYSDFIKHSAEHNTSEDWWGGTWAGMLAGFDSLQLWLDYKTEDLAKSWHDSNEDLDRMVNGFGKWVGDSWNHIGEMWNDWVADVGTSINDSWQDLTEMWDNNIKKPLMDMWNGFISMDWLFGNGGESTGSGAVGMKRIDIMGLIKSIFDFTDGIDLSWITDWINNTIIQPISTAWNNFISDPLGALNLGDFDIGSLLSSLLGGESSGEDPNAVNPVATWINNTLISPLTNFASDPLGTLSSWGLPLPQIDLGGLIQGLFNIGGEGGFDLGSWLGSIFNIDTIVSTFTNNLNIIFTTASTIASNVSMVFSNLKNMIWGHIQGILSNVTSTFTNIKNTAVNQINGLSSGIKGGIDKVVNAFNYMKDCILNSAKAIYDGVKAKFDSVKNTIGDFWHKLTNPSSWGSAGSESYQRRSPKPQTARRMFAGSPVVRSAIHHGAGVNPYQNDSQSVKLKDLMGMIDGDNKVKLSDFLAMFSEGGFGTWDFHEPVKKKVFDTAKGYKTGSPSIKGIGTVGDGYKVEKFWNGKPSFSFQEFQAVAQAIFSAIPYKFYYDSEWKGNWVNALLSGAVNCSDGADALIALANVFGLSGYKQHTTLKSGVGHFFAVIGGKPMDTTNFQNHGSWSPLGGAGIPTRTASHIGRAGETQGKTVNITVSMDNAVIYGVDDLDSRIQDSVQKGIQSEFNDPYTIAI